MNNSMKQETEKSLKRFLKKKVAYTAGLLVAFLITGSIGIASSIELASQADMSRDELLANIAAQKEEVQAQIDANNERLKELKMDQDELVRKGDFYAKPVYGSTQIFFSYGYEHEGKGKDKTNKEWKNTLNAIAYKTAGYENPKGINPYAKGEQSNGIDTSTQPIDEKFVDPDANGNIPEGMSVGEAKDQSGANIKDLLLNNNGAYVHQTPWIEEIDLGANILPLSPILPTIGTVVDVSVVTPTLATIPNPTINVPSPPSAPVITAPSLAAPAPVTPLTITPPTAPTPSVPAEKNISITAPSLPNDYEPTMVTIPTAPDAPVINIPTLVMTDFQGRSMGNDDVIYADAQTGNNSFIANIAVIDGKFTVKRTASLYEYDYKYNDYSAYTFIGGTTGGIACSTTNTLYNMADVTTYKPFSNGWLSGLGVVGGIPQGTGVQLVAITMLGTYNNGDFLVSRNIENNTFNAGEFVHMDNHSANNTFTSIKAALSNAALQVSTSMQTDVESIWDDAESAANAVGTSTYYSGTYYDRGMVWFNTGDITLEGGNLSITNQYHHGVGNTFAITNGNIVIRPLLQGGIYYDAYNAVFLLSNDCIGDNQQIMHNAGDIKLSTNDSAIYSINTPNAIGHWSSHNVGINANAINRGTIEMSGKNDLGVFARASFTENGSLTLDFKKTDGTRAPIVMYGDNNIGLYVTDQYSMTNNVIPVKGEFNVDIGDAAGTANKPISVTAAETEEGDAYTAYYGDNTNTDKIEGSVGVLSFKNTDLTKHGVVIYANTDNCIGAIPLTSLTAAYIPTGGVTIKLGNGSITNNGVSNIGIQINGGNNNLGLLASDTGGYTSGNIESTAAIDINGGDRAIGAVAQNGHSITVDTVLTSGATPAGNAVGLYANNSGSTITATSGIGNGASLKVSVDTASANNHSAMAAYALDGGVINIPKAAAGATPDVEVTGAIDAGKYVGFAYMSNGAGSTINANNSYVKVTSGAAGVAAINGGVINMQNGTVDYEGRGFAAYTDGAAGTLIDLTGGHLILRGKSVGYTIDITNPMLPTYQVILSSTGDITMMSNDAVAFNLVGIGTKTLTQVISAVTLATGSAPVIAGTEGGTTYDKFRLAATDGGNITIDSNLDKTHDLSYGAYDPSYFFFRSFLAQKSQVTVDANIDANLTNQIATDFYKGYVSGFEMNSSNTATAVTDAQITVNAGKIITADRTEAGAGAIGTYINSGTIINNGTINVETGSNVLNDSGIGIYGVDGADLQNAGTVTVAGNSASGMLGMAYRLDSSNAPVVDEFGGKAWEGATKLTNTGTITADGNATTGMYALNNSAGTSHVTQLTMTNSGTITVGTAAGSKNAIGMYGDGDVVMDFTGGTITVGENGIGMYGAKGATIQTIAGTFNLGPDGIGVISDGTANITATGTATFTGAYVPGESGKIGVAYVGPVAGTIEATPQTLGLDIDVSGLDHGSALYVRDKGSLATTGTLTVGNEGVGVFLDNGDVTNNGTINLAATGNKSVGMYTKNGTVHNAGTITETNNTQFGLVGSGASAIVDNNGGTVDLAAGTGNTGILVADGATMANEGTINFGTATESFGIVATNAVVNLQGPPTTITLANTSKNIYVYGEKGSTINIVGAATINGSGVSGNDKSVGIFLDGTNGANTLNAGTLTAQGGLIGVYSKGNNTLTSGIYNVADDGTVGIYFENSGTLDGVSINVDAPTNAIGVYGASDVVAIGPNGATLNLGPTSGTGMYMDGGASVGGPGTVHIVNTSASTLPGVYYTGTTPATHSADIDITPSSTAAVGIFTDGGANVTNAATITDNNGMSVGAVVGAAGGTASTFTNAGAITQGAAGTGSTGMYVINGTGKNTGSINVIDGIGTVLDSTSAYFDGTGGNINVNGVGTGLALTGTGAGQVVSTGNINLSPGSLGVYADATSIMDFPVTLVGTGATGVYAKGGSQITGTIDASGSTDTIGLYTEDATVVLNGATIKAGGQAASASIGVYLGGSGQNYTYSGNTIEANSTGSVGVYVSNGNIYNFGDTVNIVDGAIGIMTSGAGTTLETNNGTINITGAGIGVVANGGSVANVGVSGPINVAFNGAGGILSFTDGGTVNLGSNINILSGSGTLAATKDGSLTNSGTFNVTSGSIGLLGLYDTGSGILLNDSTGNITVSAGGIGLAAKAVSPAATGSPTVQNDNIITADGASAVGMYANIGTITNNGTINATNGGIGIYATNVDGPGAAISSLGTVNVTGGTGYVLEGGSGTPAPTATAIILNAGTAADRSIGGYYKDINGNIDMPTGMTVNGDYTIAAAIENGTNTVGNVTDIASAKNNIGLALKNSTTTVGTVTVSGPESNIGVYGSNAAMTVGSVTVGASTHTVDKSLSSIGVYSDGGTVTTQGITVGDDSIGAFGKSASIAVNGNVVTGNNALGAYLSGTGAETLTVNGDITAGEHTLGAYGQNADVTVTGNMTVKPNLGIGIVSTEKGNVTYSGTVNVEDKGAESASIGIYKGGGEGNVTTSGTFNIGVGGYAIYADNLQNATGNIAVNNSANMTLSESAVGIYAGGQTTADNTGAITVGSTYKANADHSSSEDDLNSIGMYGEKGAQISNGGNITVGYDHSVGAYVKDAGTAFTNRAGATIVADNGGVGILAVQNAKVINDGTIVVNQTTVPVCGGKTVGIGIYSGATFDNNGELTVNDGYGVYMADATTFTNNGNMTLNGGAGVAGPGTYVNSGTVVLNGGSEVVTAAGEEEPVVNGAITMSNTGAVVIGSQYVSEGTLVALGQDITLAGAMVDLTTGKTAFVGDTVNGTIKLTSDFITTGNGYSWTAQDFVQTSIGMGMSGKIQITTSPLYMAHMAGEDLRVVKQPYAYLVTGSQFDNLYNGVDSLLALDQEGTGKDAEVLKGLNAYLDNIYNTSGQDAFDEETGRTMAEMRGDIYATIKGRMNRVQNAFDNSFDELLNSYNFSRDTGKFSVIYNQGKYKDKTLGIDDYKYRTTGLLYMHEYEGRNYASKWGWTLGFGVSRFDFDDSPTFHDKSKEDVYSLRAGLHNVHSFGEDDRLRLVSKLEVGWNRHEAERTIELDKKYKNDATYDTFNVSLDNRLEKTLYRSISAGVELYGEMNLEYAKLNSFTEDAKGDSGLELKIKDKDYFSAEGAIGLKGHKRAYIGKKISAKLTGDIAYAYEFADNYGRTKAKVADGTEGYYKLIKPDEEEGKVRGKVGLTFEKADHYGITFDVEARKGNNKKGADIRYGVRLNYKFGGGR